MNKKFSTLVAAVMLATSFGTANAADEAKIPTKAGKYETGKSYVLGWFGGDSAIAVTGNRTDGFTLKSVKTSTLETLVLADSALWTVAVTPAVGGGAPKYTFVNKATQLPLAVNKADTLGADYKALPLGGSLAEWGNLKSVISADSAALTSYFTAAGKPDSVVYFAQAGNDKLVLRTEQADKMLALTTSPTDGVKPIGIAPYLASEVILSAGDLNTKLRTVEPAGAFKLKFTPDVTANAVENIFTKYDLVAVDAIGSTSPAKGHVRLQAKDQKVGKQQAYLFVDTAYHVGTESAGKLLKFALDSASFNSGAAVNAKGYALRDTLSAYFQFKFNPVNDSLSITVAKVNHKGAPQVTGTGSAWSYASDGTTALTWGTKNSTGIPADSVIRLAKLSAVTELTVGAAPSNTKITIGTAASAYAPTTLTNGVYLMKLKTAAAGRENGTYYVMGLDSLRKYAVQEASQNFMHMPSAQWFVTQTSTIANSPVTITNREFDGAAGSKPNVYKKNIQLYATADGNVFTFNDDTLTFVPVEKDLLAKSELGYKKLTKEELAIDVYALNYFHGLNKKSYVNTTDTKDSLLFVDAKEGAKVWFSMELVNEFKKYGNTTDNVKEVLAKDLYRSSYRLKVKDSNKLDNDGRYVALGTNGKYVVSKDAANASVFFLKENNCADGKEYYALIDTCEFTHDTQLKVGVADDALNLKGEGLAEVRTSAFFVEKNDNPIYRRFNTALESAAANDDPDTLKFYTVNSANHEYLYEDATSKYSKGLNNAAGNNINFLGLEGKGVNAKAAMYVDTAWVRNNTPMPQYMLVVGANVVAESNICPEHGIVDGHEVLYPGYVAGRFLINAQDSVAGAANNTAKNYVWEKKYTRLAFVPAIHRGDSLYILNDESLAKEGAKFTWEALNAKAPNKFVKNIIDMKKDGNKHKNYKFSFRLINDEAEKSFLIESEGDQIKPTKDFGWVKIQNGVPVIAKDYESIQEAYSQAEKFNVEMTTEKPVANEENAINTVSVVATDGAVIINNAAGKTVMISNMLGQTIANTVITSDNATIAVPAGIAVVAVEGEKAVKAVVR